MRKKLLTAVLIVIILESMAVSIFLLYLLRSSNNQNSAAGIYSENIDAFREEKLKSTSFYDIKADIEIAGDIAIVKQEIGFKQASKTLLAYVPSINSAETEIKSVKCEKGVSSFSLRGTMLEINCTEAQENIKIEYNISLNKNVDFLTYDGNFYYLTNFLITPVVCKGDSPITSYTSKFGDPFVYDMNNYYILFKTDKSLNINAPGKKSEHVFGANKITIFEAANIRDFPAVMFGNADVKKSRYKNVNVYYINSYSSKGYVIDALKFAEKNIGMYPYENLFVVKAPISQNGMEFSNMIFLSDKCFTDEDKLKRVTYHEVLHQWFYGIVGTDQLNEPFLDEGLVNYLSILMSNPDYFQDKPAVSDENKFANMPLNSYYSRDEYYKLAYNDASSYFYTIHKKLGNNFYRLLHELYTSKKYKILYYNEFLKYASHYRGN
jgi:hypothetical protein